MTSCRNSIELTAQLILFTSELVCVCAEELFNSLFPDGHTEAMIGKAASPGAKSLLIPASYF